MTYEGPIKIGDIVTIKKGAIKNSWNTVNYEVKKSYKVKVVDITSRSKNENYVIWFYGSGGYPATVSVKDILEA
jgi:hypothetical protein